MSVSNPRKDGPITVLIAGIGGGSLGLEILKSLRYADGYRLIGTDVSEKAFGLKGEGLESTCLIRSGNNKEYAQKLLDICLKNKVDAIAPGAEEVHKILAGNRHLFEQQGMLLMLNTEEVIDLCSDKVQSMKFLEKKGIPVPSVVEARSEEDVKAFNKFPCVVKPARASGGSNLVFLAENSTEAFFFVGYLQHRGYSSLIQEYIHPADEYTVGVLSSRTGEILGSLALKRSLETKLSYSVKYDDRIISSGWSQGTIDDFDEIRQQAEKISRALNSKWALNIQGRVKDGIFYPFEINPRHSGTTYLRALAGFNEPHILLQHCLRGQLPPPIRVKKGYYLRGFLEKYVPFEDPGTHD